MLDWTGLHNLAVPVPCPAQPEEGGKMTTLLEMRRAQWEMGDAVRRISLMVEASEASEDSEDNEDNRDSNSNGRH